MNELESQIDEILATYFTWRGEAIHEVNNTANYRRLKTALLTLVKTTHKEARKDELRLLEEQELYQVNGHDILPDTSVRVIKKQYIQDRLQALTNGDDK